MFFTSPVGVGVGSKELVAVDFAIEHLLLPAVCETPLFGFHEITSKVKDGSNVLVGGVGVLLGFRIWDKILSWEDGISLLDLSIVLDYVGDCLFGETNLVKHDVLVVGSL